MNDQHLNLLVDLFDGFGMEFRTILVDYKDTDGRDFNNSIRMLDGREDCAIVDTIRETLESDGFTLTAVQEIVSDHTPKELEKLAKRDPVGAYQCVRIMYVNSDLLFSKGV